MGNVFIGGVKQDLTDKWFSLPQSERLDKIYNYIVKVSSVQGRLLPLNELYGDGSRFGFDKHTFTVVYDNIKKTLIGSVSKRKKAIRKSKFSKSDLMPKHFDIMDENIYVLKIDLNYNSDPDLPLLMSKKKWNRIPYSKDGSGRTDGRYLYKRITEKQWDNAVYSYNRQNSKDAYSKAIQKKYNVGPDWEQNRWFVEQVRPKL
jgi:hypothetical protein